jgi:hypothetical protein
MSVQWLSLTIEAGYTCPAWRSRRNASMRVARNDGALQLQGQSQQVGPVAPTGWANGSQVMASTAPVTNCGRRNTLSVPQIACAARATSGLHDSGWSECDLHSMGLHNNKVVSIQVARWFRHASLFGALKAGAGGCDCPGAWTMLLCGL